MSTAAQTDILAAARSHFDKMRGQTIEIPEWGQDGAPLVAKFDPPTLATRQKITVRAGGNRSREMALAVILCLKHESGEPAFQDDASTLAALEGAVDPKVLARVYADVIGLTSEQVLGN